MDRRDFIKALVAIPAVLAVPSIARSLPRLKEKAAPAYIPEPGEIIRIRNSVDRSVNAWYVKAVHVFIANEPSLAIEGVCPDDPRASIEVRMGLPLGIEKGEIMNPDHTMLMFKVGDDGFGRYR